MKNHSIGIVGAGIIAENMHLPVLANLPNASVVWLADLRLDRARALGRAFGVAGVAADPVALPACDVVLLAIPLTARRPYYEALAARGSKVMVEKPFAASVEEHRAIVELFPPHALGCGYQRRYYRSTRILRRVLRENWFGPLRRLSIREGGRIQRSADVSHLDDVQQAGGGVLLSLGCHSLDWALHTTGAEGWEIHEARFVFDGELDRRLAARITLHAPAAKIDFDYRVSWLDSQPNRIELGFDRVDLVLGIGVGTSLEIRGRGGNEPLELSSTIEGAATQNQAFYLEWRQFLEGVENETPSEAAAIDTLITTALIEDLYQRGRGR